MIDLVVLGIIACGTPIAVFLLRQRGARGRRLLAASVLAFFGLVLSAMMGAHSVEITYHLVAGDTRITGEPWQFDFHFYALHLLSAVLIWQGLRALGLAWRVAGAEHVTVWRVLQPMLVTLALAAPLSAVHAFFGVMYTVLSALALILVGCLGQTEAASSDPAGRSPRALRVEGDSR